MDRVNMHFDVCFEFWLSWSVAFVNGMIWTMDQPPTDLSLLCIRLSRDALATLSCVDVAQECQSNPSCY